MKKLLALVTGLLLTLSLSACETVEIEPNVIAVVYENVRYEEGVLFVDVWITNGTAEDYNLDYSEFWFELPDETETEVAGAGFDLTGVVSSNSYVEYELEFPAEYVYYSPTELSSLDLDYGDLYFFYWFENLAE